MHVGALSAGAGRARPLGDRLHPARRPGAPRGQRSSARASPCGGCRPGRPRRCPRTSCSRSCRSSATGWPGWWQQTRPTSSTPTSGCPAWPRWAAPPGLPVPVVQTFHALGVVKARHQGAADTSPAEPRRDSSATIGRPLRPGHRHLPRRGRRAGPAWASPASGSPSCRAAWTPASFTPGRAGRARAAAGHACWPWAVWSSARAWTTVIAALARLPDAELVVAGGPQPSRAGQRRDDYRRLREAARGTASATGSSSPAASPGPACPR